MDKTGKSDFLRQLENQLKINEKALKDLEENKANPEVIVTVKQRRDHLISLINLHGGPLTGQGQKQGCCFVKTGGGW